MTITQLARIYGVSRKTIYEWNGKSKVQEEIDKKVKNMVLGIRKQMPRIGGKKLYYMLDEELRREGIKLGRDKFLKMLKRLYLLVPKRKKFIRTTESNHRFRKHSNLVKGMKISKPEQLWVSDITYVKTKEGHQYLTLITDAYSKLIMGYYLSDNMKVESSKRALKMAIKNRKYPKRKLIHHSDRGFQYCSPGYTNVLKREGIKISMTTKYDPYENAIAERINGILKDEFEISCDRQTKEEAKKHIDYTVIRYNEMRPHYSCKLMTPIQAHMQGKYKYKKWGKHSINEIWN